MKKKGFTLIELLAVIVILSVITLITIPMITNVIEESKKKALMSSVQGILDSTNYFTMSHEAGVYEFLFDKEHQGSTKKGESLDYRGNIDGEGKLYLDKEGNTSICISNDKYYAYKNYNSGIIVGERKSGNCIIGFDALTNKYVAMLDNGTGNVSNVYSKDEVNNLVDAKVTELDTKITNNTNEITNMKSNIEELQSNLNNYALQTELDKTNTNVENLSSLLNTHMQDGIKTERVVTTVTSTGSNQLVYTYAIPKCKWYILQLTGVYAYSPVSSVTINVPSHIKSAHFNNSGNLVNYPSVTLMGFYGEADAKFFVTWATANKLNDVYIDIIYGV